MALATVAMAAILAVPLYHDIRFSISVAFQADYLGDFPGNVYHSWNQRGIGYKYVLYGLYRIAKVGVDSRNLASFEAVIKLTYYAVLLSACVLFFRLLRKRLEAFGVSWIDACLTFVIALLATAPSVHMQPEEMAVVLTLGMAGFFLTENKWLNYLGGLFLPLLLSCKVITITFAFFPLILVLASRQRSVIVRAVLSCLVFSVLTALFYILVIPKEIADTRDAMLYQGSFVFSFRHIKCFLQNGTWALAHIPFLMVGGACLCFFGGRAVAGRRWWDIGLIVSLAGFAAAAVIVQAAFWPYHYLNFLPPAAIAVVWVSGALRDSAARLWACLAVSLATAALWLFCATVGPEPHADLWNYAKNAWIQEAEFHAIDDRFRISDEQETLFLAPGNQFTYIIRSKSYLRHLVPLPLQRVRGNPALRDSEESRRVLAKAMKYQGKYVILCPSWFCVELFPELAKKLAVEYTIAYTIPEEQHTILGTLQVLRRRTTDGKGRPKNNVEQAGD
ncbi:MAG: hypothetical protein WCJ35_12195 [Planctomycetota bacterium]